MRYLIALVIIVLIVFVPIFISSKRNEAASRAKLKAQHAEHGVINNEPSSGVVWFWTIVGLVAGIAFAVFGLPH
jgi:hypothetical protein